MARVVFVHSGYLVLVALAAIVGIVLGGLGTAAFARTESLSCQQDLEAIISKFSYALALRDTDALPYVLTDDVVFDVTQAGGPGPIVGLSNLIALFNLLRTIIRSETAVITNPQFNGCEPRVIVNLYSVQSMDQVLNPGDLYLPAIITGSFAEMRFADGKVSSFVMQPNLTQVFVSPQFSGVNIPSVKRDVTKKRQLSDQEKWHMLQEYVARANAQGLYDVVRVIQHTPEYMRLQSIFVH
jgi:hypothetical protein